MTETTSGRIFTSEENDISWGNDPLNYLVRVFIAFLQTIWEEAPRGSFHWTPYAEDTEIVITEENPVHTETMEKRPTLVVSLGPTRFNGTTLDDLSGVNLHNSGESHTDLMPTNVTIHSISRVPSEARFLAWQNARMIWSMRKLFIAEKGIQDCGRRNEIGPVTPAGALVVGDTEAEWSSCAVTVPVYLQWSDLVTPLKYEVNGHQIHKLEHIQMGFRGRMKAVSASLGLSPSGNDSNMQRWSASAEDRISTVCTESSLRPPMINGRVIQTGASVPVFQRTKVK
ncbi:hypothetical protein UFOVP276_42 [uncultured Caudovirales phage]|uniref:Uncharacterized protein n=1 Tax=uncultured Caudovirales phage TaxID=2100421 RepID=A0A6J5LL79_9CAUD|nr:hypothetical protein UFOVP127_179 [uncultured Caudovirales phage]CAB4134995.1 hypothetical protein UFOVP276_42 [uncultured Caudovirales phage]